MSRNARKIKGGLTQKRKTLLRDFQNLENVEKTNFPDKNQRLQNFKLSEDVKNYLKNDLQQSIELLQFKQKNLENIDPNILWEDYVKAEIKGLTYMTNGKSIKGLTGAIAQYNMFKKRADNFTRGLDRQQTDFTCGSVTCKERGQKIKEALTILSTFSPDALGSFGVMDSVASAFNWAGTSIGKATGFTKSNPGYIDPDFATFLGLPPEIIGDVNNKNDDENYGTELKSLQPINGSQQQPTSTGPIYEPAKIGQAQLNAVNNSGWFSRGTSNAQPTQSNAQPTQSNAQPTQSNAPVKPKSWFSWGGKRTRRRR